MDVRAGYLFGKRNLAAGAYCRDRMLHVAPLGGETTGFERYLLERQGKDFEIAFAWEDDGEKAPVGGDGEFTE